MVNHCINTKLSAALRLCCLLSITVWLWGCQSTPSKDGDTQASIAALSAQERQDYDRALAHLVSGQPESAEKTLTQLLRARPEVAELWLNLALSHYQQGDLPAAKNALQTLQQHSADIAQAHNLLGLMAVDNGEFDKAQEHYLAAIKLQPKYSNALFNMALLQDVYLQNIASAVDYYERYLQLAPEDTDTKNWAAGLKMSLGR